MVQRPALNHWEVVTGAVDATRLRRNAAVQMAPTVVSLTRSLRPHYTLRWWAPQRSAAWRPGFVGC